MQVARLTLRRKLPPHSISLGCQSLAQVNKLRWLAFPLPTGYRWRSSSGTAPPKKSYGWNKNEGRIRSKEEDKEETQPAREEWGNSKSVRVRSYDKRFPTRSDKTANRRVKRVPLVAFFLTLIGIYCYDRYKRYPEPRVFQPPKFTPFCIVSKEDASPTSFIITLRPKSLVEWPESARYDPYEKQWQMGTWSVEFKQPELQIARSYTPLPPRADGAASDLRFLIRREPNGEMSRYLSHLPVGAQVELRGPHTEVELPKEVTDVVFLAGGTGIAPALQVAHTLLEARKRSGDLPYIHIMWANRRREDCIHSINFHGDVVPGRVESSMVQVLENLRRKYPDNLQVDYLIDEEGTFLDTGKISKLTKRKPDFKQQAAKTKIGSKILFVSGPEGFINFLAGPKRYLGGNEVQGEVGGIIGRLKLKDWKVWKQ